MGEPPAQANNICIKPLRSTLMKFIKFGIFRQSQGLLLNRFIHSYPPVFSRIVRILKQNNRTIHSIPRGSLISNVFHLERKRVGANLTEPGVTVWSYFVGTADNNDSGAYHINLVPGVSTLLLRALKIQPFLTTSATQ